MLTKKQYEKLVGKKKIDKVTRAKYEFIAAKKLQDSFDDLRDADIVLSEVPKHKLQKYLQDEHVEVLLKTVTDLMRVLDYKKVRSVDDESLFVFVDENDSMEYPSVRDLERARVMYEFLYELEAFLDPDLLDRGAKIPGFALPSPPPGGPQDTIERQKRFDLEEKIVGKIKAHLDSGMDNINQIAKKVGCHPLLVLQVIYQTKNRQKRKV
jgi:hypothetical protein